MRLLRTRNLRMPSIECLRDNARLLTFVHGHVELSAGEVRIAMLFACNSILDECFDIFMQSYVTLHQCS